MSPRPVWYRPLFTVLLVLGVAGIVAGIVLRDGWVVAPAVLLCVTSIASLVAARQERREASD
jgi:hypothetical protein